MGLSLHMKVLIHVVIVNMQGIDRLVLCDNKVLQQLTKATFLYAPERHFETRIISKHEDIHGSQISPCQTTGPDHTGFFPFSYFDDKVWNISKQGLGHRKT